MTAVFIPSWAARIAATYPPGPEPITMQSYCSGIRPVTLAVRPGSTDPRGASPPYAPPLPDRPGPEGITLQVPGRSTMDGAYDAESSTDHRWIRAKAETLGRQPGQASHSRSCA